MNTSSLLSPSDADTQPVRQDTTPVVLSGELFQGRQEIVIRHGGHDYRLRITRQNKLILTK